MSRFETLEELDESNSLGRGGLTLGYRLMSNNSSGREYAG